MQVQLETLGSLVRRMNIALPMAAIDAQVTERLKRTARKAKIQGFRPGKAPMKMVEANYGPQVREEVLGEQVQQSFYLAVNEQKLRVAGYPRFEPQADASDVENFKFSATFEVYPEVLVGDLAGKEIEKPVTPVTEAEIDKTVEILRAQRTRFNYVEREARDGDRVIIDFKGTVDGVPFDGGSSENFPFVLGQGQMLPDFEAGVRGMKESDVKTIDVVFPADYHGKDVAGKTAQFELTLKTVSEAELPPIDAEFAKLLGVADGDIDKMREEIKKNVEREVKRRLLARTKENVMQALLDVTTIELPKALVEVELGRLMEKTRKELEGRGMQVKDLPFPPEMFTQQAERRVSLGLIMSELVSANQLEAKPEQVRALVDEFADSYEDPQEVVDWYYSTPERLDGPASMVIEDNVVEFVLGRAHVVEKELSFETLMGGNA
jgi:trigger factor